MGKIVLNHYLVANLPPELRGALDLGARARVTVEVEDAPHPPSVDELHALALRDGVTVDDAVARIRELRDEWDD